MSKVEVDQVTQQSGTTLTVGGGACKTAVVDATTVTLGRCGGTVSLASGATQSGFGRTGTVDWITTPKVTGDSPITGVTGKGYFLNTTAGTITVNLPAGAAGSIVSMADYAATWQTNNVTVTPNGSEKIGGTNASGVLSTEGQSVTFVYVDAVQGWVNTMDSTSNVRGATYIVATGGNQPTAGGCIVCTNYKIHKFTGPGTFCVSAGSGPLALADYMVVAGGGGGGGSYGGGGGAGGYRESPGTASGCYTASPLGTSPAAALTLSVQGYPIVVGGGGAGGSGPTKTAGTTGGLASFDSITSAGGGGGAPGTNPPGFVGLDGGSGGGGGSPGSAGTGAGGSGDTPSTPVAQGKDGGSGAHDAATFAAGGGGGGATVVGTSLVTSPVSPSAGPGGTGATTSIDATPTGRAGGGGGGSHPALPAGGGTATCGGGAGATPDGGTGAAGTINSGGGAGGGGGCTGNGGLGGSGVVIIRYKFQ